MQSRLTALAEARDVDASRRLTAVGSRRAKATRYWQRVELYKTRIEVSIAIVPGDYVYAGRCVLTSPPALPSVTNTLYLVLLSVVAPTLEELEFRYSAIPRLTLAHTSRSTNIMAALNLHVLYAVICEGLQNPANPSTAWTLAPSNVTGSPQGRSIIRQIAKLTASGYL